MSDYETHESYGVVGFHKCTGYVPKMFGSSIPHNDFVKLEIKRAEIKHDLGRDWIYSDDQLIEVWLSSHQFSSLLTTMNVGDGVPCTIRRVDKKRMEDIPEGDKSEPTKIKDGFEDSIKEVMAGIAERKAVIKEILEKKTINKGDRATISEALAYIERELESNMPFVLDSFHKSIEGVATEVKANVDAFITNTITRAGMEHLKGPKDFMLSEKALSE